jgi:hypothetical protein
MEQCHVSISAIKRAWVVPYVGVIVFEVGSSDHLSSLSVTTNMKQLY